MSRDRDQSLSESEEEFDLEFTKLSNALGTLELSDENIDLLFNDFSHDIKERSLQKFKKRITTAYNNLLERYDNLDFTLENIQIASDKISEIKKSYSYLLRATSLAPEELTPKGRDKLIDIMFMDGYYHEHDRHVLMRGWSYVNETDAKTYAKSALRQLRRMEDVTGYGTTALTYDLMHTRLITPISKLILENDELFTRNNKKDNYGEGPMEAAVLSCNMPAILALEARGIKFDPDIYGTAEQIVARFEHFRPQDRYLRTELLEQLHKFIKNRKARETLSDHHRSLESHDRITETSLERSHTPLPGGAGAGSGSGSSEVTSSPDSYTPTTPSSVSESESSRSHTALPGGARAGSGGSSEVTSSPDSYTPTTPSSVSAEPSRSHTTIPGGAGAGSGSGSSEVTSSPDSYTHTTTPSSVSEYESSRSHTALPGGARAGSGGSSSRNRSQSIESESTEEIEYRIRLLSSETNASLDRSQTSPTNITNSSKPKLFFSEKEMDLLDKDLADFIKKMQLTRKDGSESITSNRSSLSSRIRRNKEKGKGLS